MDDAAVGLVIYLWLMMVWEALLLEKSLHHPRKQRARGSDGKNDGKASNQPFTNPFASMSSEPY